MKMEENKELRYMEFRALESPEENMIIEGYAIVFDIPQTHSFGKYKFTEVIKRNALDFTNMKDIVLRYNHNDTVCVLARTKNNSLELNIDDTGLKIKATLIDTQSNRDIYKSIKAGLIDSMSFAFSVAPKGDTWDYGENETYRNVTNIEKIFDVSVVDTPFYEDTSVYARKFDEHFKSEKQKEFEFRKRKFLIEHSI